jgi:hypothetical protein
MTEQHMTTLTPGPELDARVAEACGVKGRICERDDGMAFHENRPPHVACPDLPGDPWQPSTDANAALDAAEKGGLFKDGIHTVALAWSEQGWSVIRGEGVHCVSLSCGNFATPCLAICAAILALAETSRLT